MKKIIIALLFFFLFGPHMASAHLSLPHVLSETTEATGFNFLIVKYKTQEDIQKLFTKSSRVLGYFADIDGGEPFLLALATEDQQKSIETDGYSVQNLDTNATLSNYMLLYNQAPDQSDKLSKYAEIFPLSPHYTLIKIADGKAFNPHDIPDAVSFGPVPFLEGISPPPTASPTKAPTPAPIEELESSNTGAIFFIGGFVAFILIVGGIIFVILKKGRKNPPATPTQTPQMPPTPIMPPGQQPLQ